jgi:hypothetical protein
MTERINLVQERVESTVFGAVVFILNPDGEVLTFRENETKVKTGKKAGDFSVLCETREKGEVAMINAVRGLHEELGIPYSRINELFDLRDARIWETAFMPGVWATVSVIRCSDPAKLKNAIGTSGIPDGVDIIGWKTRKELEESSVRIGVKNILDKFANEIFE